VVTLASHVSLPFFGFCPSALAFHLLLSGSQGFASLERIKELFQKQGRYFVLRIKNNVKLETLENGRFLIGTGKKRIEGRVVAFCDLEERTDFRRYVHWLQKLVFC
jgi:hypothetical protein